MQNAVPGEQIFHSWLIYNCRQSCLSDCWC